VGYFASDQDSRPGALVLNRIVTLRESYVEKKPDAAAGDRGEKAERTESAKAKTRPKSKSPVEYRAEARARDADLAAAFTRASAMVSAESADLLTGDRATAQLFLAAAERARPETAAKVIIMTCHGRSASRGAAWSRLLRLSSARWLAAVRRRIAADQLGQGGARRLIRTGKPFAELRRSGGGAGGRPGPCDRRRDRGKPGQGRAYKAGKAGLLGFFVGQVMKSSPGADAAAVNKALRDRLGLTRRSAVRRSDPGKSAAIGLLTVHFATRGADLVGRPSPIGLMLPRCRRVITDRIVHS